MQCEYLREMRKLRDLADYMIFLANNDVGGVELPDEYCDISSAMPQKKNPDTLEIIRGKYPVILSKCNQLALTGNEEVCVECKEIVDNSHGMITGLISKTEFKKPGLEEKVKTELHQSF